MTEKTPESQSDPRQFEHSEEGQFTKSAEKISAEPGESFISPSMEVEEPEPGSDSEK